MKTGSRNSKIKRSIWATCNANKLLIHDFSHLSAYSVLHQSSPNWSCAALILWLQHSMVNQCVSPVISNISRYSVLGNCRHSVFFVLTQSLVILCFYVSFLKTNPLFSDYTIVNVALQPKLSESCEPPCLAQVSILYYESDLYIGFPCCKYL